MIQAKTYYCGRAGGVRKLVDLAGAWIDVSLPPSIPDSFQSELFDVEVDPNNGDKVFVVGEAHPLDCNTNWFGIGVSSDGGVTWQVPGGNYQLFLDAALCYHKWIEISIVDSTTSYVCGIINSTLNKGTVVKSTDGGLTFNSCAPLPAAVDGMDVTSIHFTSTLVGVVGMSGSGTSSYVCKTIDGGNTWTVMNGGLALSTSNPFPGTALPLGAITGIHITNDESYIIGIGQDFIVESVPVIAPAPLNTAGMAADTWQKNFYPPGGTFGNPIGAHLSYLPPSYGNDNWIFVSGLAELGINSNDPRNTWTNPPAPGYQPAGTGFSRIAAHFYNLDFFGKVNGFYSKDSAIYQNSDGFNPAFETFSEVSPYGINAVWTWYLEQNSPQPTCYLATNCDGSTIVTSTDLSALVTSGAYFNISGYSGCFIASVSQTCTGSIPIVVAGPVYLNCAECNPPPPICYQLVDCAGIRPTIITDSILGNYVGQTITLAVYPGTCWQVTISNTCTGSVPLNTTVTANYPDCISCSTICYTLLDCSSSFPPILTNTNLAAYLGKTITLSNYPGICWIVQQAPNCTGSTALTSTITSTFVDCPSCLQRCYKLTDCTGTAPAIITNADLSEHVDKVIKIQGCDTVCYFVTTVNDCTGSVSIVVNTSYDTCEICSPPKPRPEITLKTRQIQPNYGGGNCSIELIEKVNCGFASQVYNKMIQEKYGIKTCIDDQLIKYTIKKELLDLNLIYDPNACIVVPAPVVCPEVPVVPPTPIPCSSATSVVVTLSDPLPISCGTPAVIDVEIVYQVP